MAIAERSAVLGLTRSESHGYQWFDGKAATAILPSVTTIMGVLDKSGPLIGWARAHRLPGWVRGGAAR